MRDTITFLRYHFWIGLNIMASCFFFFSLFRSLFTAANHVTKTDRENVIKCDFCHYGTFHCTTVTTHSAWRCYRSIDCAYLRCLLVSQLVSPYCQRDYNFADSADRRRSPQRGNAYLIRIGVFTQNHRKRTTDSSVLFSAAGAPVISRRWAWSPSLCRSRS